MEVLEVRSESLSLEGEVDFGLAASVLEPPPGGLGSPSVFCGWKVMDGRPVSPSLADELDCVRMVCVSKPFEALTEDV